MKKKRTLAPYVFVAPYVVLFSSFYLFTIGYAGYVSLFRERGGVRKFIGLSNYVQAFGDAVYWEGFARVFLFAIVYVILLEIIAVALSLFLDSQYVKVKGLFRLTYFLPYAVPGVIAAIMWGFLYSPNLNSIIPGVEKLLGTELAILTIDRVIYGILNICIWEWAGYNITIFFANLTSISPDLYEAARIDGCTEWQTAVRIKLPLLKNTVVMTMLLTIIGALQLFNEPFILNYMVSIPAGYTPNIYVYRMAFSYGNFPYSSALSILMTAVTIIASLAFLFFTSDKSVEKRMLKGGMR